MQKRFRKLYVFLGLIGSLSLPETGFSADKWISIRSRNFLLVGNASESAMRRVGRNLEEFRAGFALIMPAIDKQTAPPITVVVFKDDSSFRPFKPIYEGKPASLAGFFQAGSDVNFIALTGDTQTPHVIYHEFVHSLTKDLVALPAWASEGLAEFYGTFDIDSDGKEMMLGRPMEEHVVTLRQSFMPVETLFALDHDSPIYNEQTKQGIFYAESWAVMHYLMLGNNQQRRPQLAKFLSLLTTGKPTEESFREAFQMDYKTLEKELQSYISRFSFPVIRYTLKNKIDFDREMKVSTLSEAQAQYYLGDMLLHIGRLDTAETYLSKAVSMDGSFAPSFASLGMLKMRQDKDEDALKYLTQAVQANSNDYMVHYYYSYMLMSAGAKAASDDDASRYGLMRQHLKKSIELAPGYWNAYGMLGYVALVLKDELTETEDLLKKAFTAAPGNRDIRLRLAELMVANKELGAALYVVRPLAAGEDDAIRNKARSLMDRIERYTQQEQALKEYEERRRQFEANAAALAAAAAVVADAEPDEPTDERPALTRAAERSSGQSMVETAKPQIKRPAGTQIEGALISADCSRGLTLRIQMGNGMVELHSDNPSRVEFVSYTSAVSDSFACGSFRSAAPVLVLYRRVADPRYLGEPVRVEFVDKK